MGTLLVERSAAFQGALWPRDIPRIHSWFPGETLFSLCSRFHNLTGNALHARTCQQLFGHARDGTAHDFPARLDEFVRRTQGALGDIEGIVDHTLLPFYFPFRAVPDAQNAIAAVRNCGLGAIKGKLGMLASRFGSSHPLKACSSCMIDDAQDHGVSIWHLDHQYPSSWICARHLEPLHFSLFKISGEGRFHWALPRDTTLQPGLPHVGFGGIEDLLVRYADCGRGLTTLPRPFVFDPERIVETYRRRMVEQSLASDGGPIRTTAFLQRVLDVTVRLRVINGHASLPYAEEAAAAQFLRLVRRPRSSAHPIRHFILILALFGRWRDFLSAYYSTANPNLPPEVAGPAKASGFGTAANNAARAALLKSVQRGIAVSAAAKAVGVSIETGMEWVASSGARNRRRPKVLVPGVRQKAIRMLSRGRPHISVARVAGVTSQTIRRLLRTEPGLQAAWVTAQNQRKRDHTRRLWQRAAKHLEVPTPSLLRQVQPAIFAWLYRNDRAWLVEFSKTLPNALRSNHAGVRWDERDRELAIAIRREASALAKECDGRLLTMSQLVNRVPNLKSYLPKLDRLPLTGKALSEVPRWRHGVKTSLGRPLS